ncbi:adenosylhomocysteinase [Burkholderia cenocepacia]|nr:adenosylhomocysteinase [Burkholderia cenocepacia]
MRVPDGRPGRRRARRIHRCVSRRRYVDAIVAAPAQARRSARKPLHLRGVTQAMRGRTSAARHARGRLNCARHGAIPVRRPSHARRVLRCNVICRNGCATRTATSPPYGTGADHALRRPPGPARRPCPRRARRAPARAGRFRAPRVVVATIAGALPSRPRFVDRPARADRGRTARSARQGGSLPARVGPVPDAAARHDPRRRLLRDADRRARRDDRLPDRPRTPQRLPSRGAAHRLVLVGKRGRNLRRRERADRSRADHRAQDRSLSRGVHDAHVQRGTDLLAGRRTDRRARRVGRAFARRPRQPAPRLPARTAERGADRGRLLRAQHRAALDIVRASESSLRRGATGVADRVRRMRQHRRREPARARRAAGAARAASYRRDLRRDRDAAARRRAARCDRRAAAARDRRAALRAAACAATARRPRARRGIAPPGQRRAASRRRADAVPAQQRPAHRATGRTRAARREQAAADSRARRDRRRQGSIRARDPRRRRAARAAVRRRQLRRAARSADRERTVRLRGRRLHRRTQARRARQDRARRRRHAVSR